MLPDFYVDQDADPEADVSPDYCPTCFGEPEALGMLGRLVWLRCHQCGMEWNREVFNRDWNN